MSCFFTIFFLSYFSITGSPKTLRKLPTGGIGHHINPIHNPHPNRSNQSVQQQQTGTAMPHYGGGAEKCARCARNVYLAEKKVGAGRVCLTIVHLYRIRTYSLVVVSYELF